MAGDLVHIIGIDLSGPTNIQDTVFLAFVLEETGLRLTRVIRDAGDEAIQQGIIDLLPRGPVVVGLDAPLSYNPGGGDRPGDRALRKKITAVGLHPGSVMAPTMTRMAYLTLRGMTVARSIRSIPKSPPDIVEVHPGAAMALRGAPIDDVRTYKVDPGARQRLLGWLFSQGLACKELHKNPDDHQVSACAAALAAWQWHLGNPAWMEPAAPPHHPFDYAC